MCVAEDADVGLFSFQKCLSVFGDLPAFIKNVPEGNTAACQLDHGLRRKSVLFIIIDIALARIIHKVSAASADTRL